MSALQRYTRPSSFADFAQFDRREYFTIGGQHRDSETLSRSNHRSILRALGGESETVLVIRDNHWAIGWIEAIYIHQSDTAALAIAERIANRLDDYPVVDEEDWSELEYETAANYWERMSVSERIDYCRDYGVSIFAARRADLPRDAAGELVPNLADGV